MGGDSGSKSIELEQVKIIGEKSESSCKYVQKLNGGQIK